MQSMLQPWHPAGRAARRHPTIRLLTSRIGHSFLFIATFRGKCHVRRHISASTVPDRFSIGCNHERAGSGPSRPRCSPVPLPGRRAEPCGHEARRRVQPERSAVAATRICWSPRLRSARQRRDTAGKRVVGVALGTPASRDDGSCGPRGRSHSLPRLLHTRRGAISKLSDEDKARGTEVERVHVHAPILLKVRSS